jgi:hypothetical protein
MSINDLLKSASDKKPSDFTNTFKGLVNDRVQQKLRDKLNLGEPSDDDTDEGEKDNE